MPGGPGPQDFDRELAPLWHTHPQSISGVERDRDLGGYCDYPADQAELLSRLLRRPRLLVWPAGRGARAVCLYHHARLDLVVEWFGGPPVAEVAAAFLAAGLDLRPRDRAAQGLKDGTWPEWTLKLHAGTMELVLIQAEQGYWAGDFDSYGRTPSWLRRLHARGQRRRQR